MLWFTFSLGSAFVFILNIARAQDRTTVVPGVSTLWYRIYSAILFLLMLALFITATIETKETWCGKVTIFNEEAICGRISYLPQDTYMYFNATVPDGSSSWTGSIYAKEAYLAATTPHATLEDYTLPDGTFVPKDHLVSVSTHAMRDPQVNTDATTWDGCRFPHQHSRPGKELSAQLATTSLKDGVSLG
ncbi:unnamed protein product [Alternaria alternata]